MAEVLHLTKENFEKEVLNSDGKVLVDFWAEWCGPCRMMTPVLTQLADENLSGLKIGKVNVDEEPDLARRYQVLSIPVLKVFEGGNVVAEQVGAVPKQALMRLLGAE